MMKRLCSLLLVAAMPVLAQDAPRAHGLLQGVAVDSLRGGFLRGAVLSIEGTSRMGVTDSLGRFQIDSVPPGTYAIELHHELLDTLGVRVRTPAIGLARDSTTLLVLGIPSAETIVRAKCGASADSSAALLGMVIAADSEHPLVNAEVNLWWLQIEVGREIGVRREPRSRRTTTDAAGRYLMCGLPSDLSAEISASRGRDSTSVVSVTLGGAKLAVATLFLPGSDFGTAAAPAAPVPNAATVRGVVVDSAGNPVAGARVSVGSSPDAAITDSAGAFLLAGRPSGTHALIVRRLGYRPTEVAINLTRRTPRDVVVRLNTFVPMLEAVYIEASRNLALDRVGFNERQKAGHGRYLTKAELDRRHAFRVSDFLRHLPPERAFGMDNRTCTNFWVDGNKWLGDVDDFIMPEEVMAMEVYSPSFVPAEFQDFSGPCRVVVLWTRWKLRVR